MNRSAVTLPGAWPRPGNRGRSRYREREREVSGRMTTITRQDLNFGQVVADVLCEFLEVAVHLILYVREVYPVGIFQKRKKYNVPVQSLEVPAP